MEESRVSDVLLVHVVQPALTYSQQVKSSEGFVKAEVLERDSERQGQTQQGSI